MSVVFEAVNTFFGHSSNHHHHPHTAAYRDVPAVTSPASSHGRHSRTPSRPRDQQPLMSASAQRASSSSATRTVQQRERAPSTESRATPTPRRDTAPQQQQPPSPSLGASAAPPPPEYAAAPGGVAEDARPTRARKIRVRDLEHIQSFATEDMGAFSANSSRSTSRGARGDGSESPQYEISDMKVEHIIEMVAGLLTKITTTNDQQHEHLHRQPPSVESAANMNQQTSSVLAFHGKNVPSITILSYLSRIHKYCPTSYEVFLSLLVYFDRMTERVNAGPMESLRQANQQAVEQNSRSGSANSSSSSLNNEAEEMEGVAPTTTTPSGTQQATPPASGGLEKGTSISGVPGTPHSRPQEGTESPGIPSEPNPALLDPHNLSHFFVVDSFNIHRLVIAGVTCASKFFSDIFYTNSRYAKVGGLPLPELNHLELQFLLLNDFRLSVPVEEIEAYGTMLVEFYAREVVAQQKLAEAEALRERSLSEGSNESAGSAQSVETVRAVG